jgi:hypothetical protein
LVDQPAAKTIPEPQYQCRGQAARRGCSGNQADIMWASAPDAFEVLKDKKLLQAYRPKATGIPEKVGAYPIKDPDGYYSGFAMSGYGIMWNERYTKANKLPDPKEWQDLAEAIYFDQVSIAPRSAPARRTSPSRRSCRARVGKRADRAPGYGAITSLAHNRQISADIDVTDGANGKIVTALTKWVEAELPRSKSSRHLSSSTPWRWWCRKSAATTS